ncbi:MAG: YgcG family protein, partial [Cyanobacteria bacterium J06626_18]
QDIASSVAQDTIGVPLRQDSKYNQAMLDASDRLIAVLSGEPDPGPPTEVASYEIESTFASAEETDENRNSSTVIVVGFLIAATIIPMATYYFYQSMGG